MSGVTVRWEGLEEFRRDLRAQPTTLTAQAVPLAVQAAQRTARTTLAAYPRRTGRLAAGVSVEPGAAAGATVSARALTSAPHAHVYEAGSSVRSTTRGENRGIMPAARVFVPAAQAARVWFVAAVADAVRDEGYTVTS